MNSSTFANTLVTWAAAGRGFTGSYDSVCVRLL